MRREERRHVSTDNGGPREQRSCMEQCLSCDMVPLTQGKGLEMGVTSQAAVVCHPGAVRSECTKIQALHTCFNVCCSDNAQKR